MALPFIRAALATGADGAITLSAPWSAISYTSPITQLANEDRTLTFVGPARDLLITNSAGGTLEYRINSGSWITVSGVIAFSNGQTLGFRWGYIGNATGSVTVRDAVSGEIVGTFSLSASGF